MTQPDHDRFAGILDILSSRQQPLCPDPALQEAIGQCIDLELDQLPLPGHGDTLQRWQILARVAQQDLSLAKLYESHTDAVAILHELDAAHLQPAGVGAVWAAEPPYARVLASLEEEGSVYLSGTKAWCSGATQLDWALITAWTDQSLQQLAIVDLHQTTVTIGNQGWQAVGMAATASVEVNFQHARADRVGAPGDYLNRPGFWQGGAGVAACWYGAATGLADRLRHHCQRRSDPHALAHLGAVDAALSGAAAALRECAHWIDAHPAANAQVPVRRARAQVEQAADQVLQHVGRAMGATPFCRDAGFARLAADLPVFMRQSHAERDLAELGRLVTEQAAPQWRL